MHAFAMTAVVGLMAMSGGAQLPPVAGGGDRDPV